MAKNKRPQMPSGEPWERMDGETVQQYEKFCAYRDMRYTAPAGDGELPKLDLTRERSIRGLAKKLGLSRKTLEPLSARFRWVDRCEAYDLYILRRLKEKGEAEILQMHENHAMIASQMLKKALRGLLKLSDDDLDATDIVRMVDVGVKIERLSRGESTERQEIGGETTVRHSGAVAVTPVSGLACPPCLTRSWGTLSNSLANYIQSRAFDPEALRAAIKKERAERSLSEFIRQAWPVIEPGTTYIENWHTDLISEHLQAVNLGQIHRLIINIPPRHMKSIHATVSYPVWTWLKAPEKRFIKVSYSDNLSRKHNILSRDIIRSIWYQTNWSDRFHLKDDVNRQNEFRNDHQGMMMSTSVGGALTGEGGDVIIIDDPQNPLMANSETERQNSINFFKNTLQTRLNDPKTGAIIIIMQRLHESDLTGYVLSEGLGYTHLCLPAEAEERTVITYPITHRKVIREPGDLLNPARFDKDVLDGLKKSMGSVQYAGQFQQTPAPAEGIIFKREWMNNQFKKQSLPYLSMIIQSWDMAFTKSEGSAKVAGFVLARAGSNIYILDLENDKMTFTESVAAVRRLSGKWPRARAKVVENKANGPAIVDLLKKEIPGMVEFNPKGSKEERAISVTPYFEAGNIWFPDPREAPWVNDLVRDLLIFPKGAFKDTVDALVQGILYLMDKPAVSGPPKELDGLTKESYWRR